MASPLWGRPESQLSQSLTRGFALNKVSHLLKVVCFTRFELSIQSAFHQSLTLLVLYRSRADIEPSGPQHPVFALPRPSNVTESYGLFVWQVLPFTGLSPSTEPFSNLTSEPRTSHTAEHNEHNTGLDQFHLPALTNPVLSPILRISQLFLIPLLNEMLQLRR